LNCFCKTFFIFSEKSFSRSRIADTCLYKLF
jgi:hypothetical protein